MLNICQEWGENQIKMRRKEKWGWYSSGSHSGSGIGLGVIFTRSGQEVFFFYFFYQPWTGIEMGQDFFFFLWEQDGTGVKSPLPCHPLVWTKEACASCAIMHYGVLPPICKSGR